MSNQAKPRKKLLTTANMTRISMLAALAIILFMVPFLKIVVIPHMYTLDFSNVPILLGALAMGPAVGMIILVMKEIVHLVFQGLADNQGVGNVADLVMSAAYILPAAFLYQKNKTRKTALIGMGVSTVSIVVFGVLANWLILLPFYTLVRGFPMPAIIHEIAKVFPFIDSEAKLLLFFVAPFNLVKGLAVSLITFAIYKPLSPILHAKNMR